MPKPCRCPLRVSVVLEDGSTVRLGDLEEGARFATILGLDSGVRWQLVTKGAGYGYVARVFPKRELSRVVK